VVCYCCIVEFFSLLIQLQTKKKEYLTNFKQFLVNSYLILLLLVT